MRQRTSTRPADISSALLPALAQNGTGGGGGYELQSHRYLHATSRCTVVSNSSEVRRGQNRVLPPHPTPVLNGRKGYALEGG